MELVVIYLLKALMVLVLARLLPGVRVDGFRSALAVAVVYALLNTGLMWLLKILTLPAIILTFGLFTFVLQGFLLWMTDKLVSSFKVEGLGSLAVATLAFSLGNVIVEALAAIILA